MKENLINYLAWLAFGRSVSHVKKAQQWEARGNRLATRPVAPHLVRENPYNR